MNHLSKEAFVLSKVLDQVQNDGIAQLNSYTIPNLTSIVIPANEPESWVARSKSFVLTKVLDQVQNDGFT
ncbi:hypothetical protein BCS95_11900 [Vibrio breoganii]|nr:hypothetical protein BCS95_11900 [Vibrio breoganii]